MNVRPYVWTSAFTVAPLNIARKTQNKIHEAMTMGVPVVSSGIAAGGVDAIVGEYLLVADSPMGYADTILRVLNDPAARQRFSTAGRERMITTM